MNEEVDDFGDGLEDLGIETYVEFKVQKSSKANLDTEKNY